MEKVVSNCNIVYCPAVLTPPPPTPQAQLAVEFGCRALLIYSDPQEYAPKDVPVYPDGPALPEFGIQRGFVSMPNGDPLTPGIPSIRKFLNRLNKIFSYLTVHLSR